MSEISVHEMPQEPRHEQMSLPLNPNAGTFIPEVKVEEPRTMQEHLFQK